MRWNITDLTDYLSSLGDQTYLDDFHWINAFWWLLSNEASYPSILYIQTGMLLTCHLQQMHKGLIYQHILFGKEVKKNHDGADKMVYTTYRVFTVLHFMVKGRICWSCDQMI